MGTQVFINGKQTDDAIFVDNVWNWGIFNDFDMVHTQDADSIPHEFVYFAEYTDGKVHLYSNAMDVIDHELS